MAKKTMLVCDSCGNEIESGTGATMRASFTDARRNAKLADLCTGCAEALPGSQVARRGRPPKAAAVAA